MKLICEIRKSPREESKDVCLPNVDSQEPDGGKSKKLNDINQQEAEATKCVQEGAQDR
jgi:hypothetical protein